MRTLLAAAVFSILAVVETTSQVRANVVIGDKIVVADGIGHPGGLFNIDVLTSSTPNFDTFCVELSEVIRFGPTYRVDNIGTVAVQSGKVLTPFAAWLYHKFRTNSLASFNATNPLIVNTLQFGIWKAMNHTQLEIDTMVGPGWFATYDPILTFFGWEAAFNADSQWSGIGNVRIMNLVDDLTGEDAQDGMTEVPEPVSIVVWTLIVMLLGSMGGYHRRPPLQLAV